MTAERTYEVWHRETDNLVAAYRSLEATILALLQDGPATAEAFDIVAIDAQGHSEVLAATPTAIRRIVRDWTRTHSPTKVRGYVAGPNVEAPRAQATTRSVEVALGFGSV